MRMLDHSTVGLRIRSIRLSCGLSQAQLAALSGVSQGMLSDVERDAKQPSLPTLTGLAAALRVPIGALADPMPAPIVERCGSCRFWAREHYQDPTDRSSLSAMACRRYAPRAGGAPAWREIDDFCGEFAPAQPPNQNKG